MFLIRTKSCFCEKIEQIKMQQRNKQSYRKFTQQLNSEAIKRWKQRPKRHKLRCKIFFCKLTNGNKFFNIFLNKRCRLLVLLTLFHIQSSMNKSLSFMLLMLLELHYDITTKLFVDRRSYLAC